MSQTNNLRRNPACASMSGIKKIEFTEANNVTAFTRSARGISLSAAASAWRAIELDEGVMSSPDNGNGGYDTEITGVFCATGTEIDRTLAEMREQRFILRLTDNKGVKWIAGTRDQPLRFEYGHNNDGTPDGKTAYDIRFYAATELPPQIN